MPAFSTIPDIEIANWDPLVFGRVRTDPRAALRIHAPSFARSRLRLRGCAGARLCPTGESCPCAATMMAAMVISISPFDGRAPTQPRMDGSGPRDGCASIAFPQRLSQLFSPAAK